jgi:ribosomal protein S18 acetylase RimI-like enzyme
VKEISIRPPTAGDQLPLRAFFERIPEEDRNFFKEQVLDGGTLATWTADTQGHRLLAWDGDRVVAYCAVLPGSGWSSHVGEVRLVVDPKYRRRGLGRRLARAALLESVRMGLEKLYVELVADQEAAVAMFQEIGFVGEALLRDHVRDRRGDLHDLIVLTHDVGQNVAGMQAAGLDEI